MARQLGSKRGQYANLNANLNANAGKEKGAWEVKKVKIPKELAETDAQRINME